MNSKLTKMEKVWAEVRDTDDPGCLTAMKQVLQLDFDSAQIFNQSVCPVEYNSNITCHTECIFSCVDYDVQLLAQVLRTLGDE